jgi:hypothetical protein
MSDRRGHVVVVGDDRVGVRVLEELVALGVEVRAVSAGPDTAFARAAGPRKCRSWSAIPRAAGC